MEIDPLAVVSAIDGVATELRSLKESVDDLERMLFNKLGGMEMDNLNVTVFVDGDEEDEEDEEEAPKEPTKIEVKEA